jgi:hypothetical protein
VVLLALDVRGHHGDLSACSAFRAGLVVVGIRVVGRTDDRLQLGRAGGVDLVLLGQVREAGVACTSTTP